MDAKNRNAVALHKRINDLIGEFVNQYRSILVTLPEDEDANFSQSAQKELAIKEGAAAIVTAAQNMTMLIRDLQELWLFGGLDTIANKKDAEKEKEKVLQVAELVERLTKKMPEASKVPDVGDGARNGAT